ncbi:MAG: hypothetical protein ABW104_06890 [Candidatus Thiodiazotropha sp. 6PLUC2]
MADIILLTDGLTKSLIFSAAMQQHRTIPTANNIVKHWGHPTNTAVTEHIFSETIRKQSINHTKRKAINLYGLFEF